MQHQQNNLPPCPLSFFRFFFFLPFPQRKKGVHPWPVFSTRQISSSSSLYTMFFLSLFAVLRKLQVFSGCACVHADKPFRPLSLGHKTTLKKELWTPCRQKCSWKENFFFSGTRTLLALFSSAQTRSDLHLQLCLSHARL
jgi:hypothetical protein